MEKKIKIGFVPASRAMFSADLAVKARRETLKSMRAAGITPVVPSKDMTPHGLVESFEDAGVAAELFRREKVAGVIVGAANFGNEVPAAVAAIDGAAGAPIFIFGCAEDGELTYTGLRRDAFCGLLSIATALRQRQAKYTFPQVANCAPSDPALVEEFRRFARVCRAVTGVRGAVYGMVGTRPAEFETCAFDELALLRKFGIRNVPISLNTVFEQARALTGKDGIKKTVNDLAKAFDVEGVHGEALDRLARLRIVLERLIDSHGMSGMALQCWTGMQEHYHVSACSVMALINESRGVPVACEVDIHGTLSMHLLQLAAGRPAVLMDWNNRHYKDKNLFSAWHCGVYPTGECMGKCRIAVNLMMNRTYGDDNVVGVLDGTFRPGPVTMARVTQGADGEWKMIVVEGEAVKAAGEPHGGHAWVRVADLDKLYRALLRDFPHHGGMVHGHVGSEIAEAARFLCIRVIAPLPISRVDPAQIEPPDIIA